MERSDIMERIYTLEHNIHFYKTSTGKATCRYELGGNIIQLKNLKVFDDMSEETLCFVADVYFNGKKVGSAENNGKGGCANFYITCEKDDVVKNFYDFVNNELEKQNKYCYPNRKMNIFDALDYLANYQNDIDSFRSMTGVMDYLKYMDSELERIRIDVMKDMNKTNRLAMA